jgi:hypothetical protein
MALMTAAIQCRWSLTSVRTTPFTCTAASRKRYCRAYDSLRRSVPLGNVQGDVRDAPYAHAFGEQHDGWGGDQNNVEMVARVREQPPEGVATRKLARYVRIELFLRHTNP